MGSLYHSLGLDDKLINFCEVENVDLFLIYMIDMNHGTVRIKVKDPARNALLNAASFVHGEANELRLVYGCEDNVFDRELDVRWIFRR